MPELRHDPIQKQWVVIAPERGKRPPRFTPVAQEAEPEFCPFCPGHEEQAGRAIRVIGANEPGSGASWKVRVLPNRFPALVVEGELKRRAKGIYDYTSGIGAHEVIVETPDHKRHLPDQSLENVSLLLGVWRERLEDLLRDIRLRSVLVFKNHGQAAGSTIAHPHSQVVATPVTPRILITELASAREHFRIKERCLYCDVIEQEIEDGSRLVELTDQFVAFCPFASRSPFEVHILPRKHRHDFTHSSPELLMELASVLRSVLRRLRKGLEDPPYNLVLHTAPNTRSGPPRPGYWTTLDHDFHWHIEIYPRLTQQAGFEWGTGLFINPTEPETAASFLRDVKAE